jgi:hypothetical protein
VYSTSSITATVPASCSGGGDRPAARVARGRAVGADARQRRGGAVGLDRGHAARRSKRHGQAEDDALVQPFGLAHVAGAEFAEPCDHGLHEDVGRRRAGRHADGRTARDPFRREVACVVEHVRRDAGELRHFAQAVRVRAVDFDAARGGVFARQVGLGLLTASAASRGSAMPAASKASRTLKARCLASSWLAPACRPPSGSRRSTPGLPCLAIVAISCARPLACSPFQRRRADAEVQHRAQGLGHRGGSAAAAGAATAAISAG